MHVLQNKLDRMLIFKFLFQAIVGDKYGYRPIPRSVEEGLFESLASVKVQGWELVEEWYRKDMNAVPAVYILQPISSKIHNYNNMVRQNYLTKSNIELSVGNQLKCRPW